MLYFELKYKSKKCRLIALTALVIMIAIVWIFVRSEGSGTHSYEIRTRNRKYFFNLDFALEDDMSKFIRSNKMIFQGEKIVHMDLKGAPPKISYFKYFFNLLAKLGATGVLIEYEDMFPYHGRLLGNISAYNAYSLNDIRTINNMANKMNLKVIPLIQTFGHLEFILKLKEWKYLREVSKYPQVICPSHEETLSTLTELIEQVIEAHPYSNMLHIGADEVYLLGECNKCFHKMNVNGWTKQKLFLHHVSSVSKMIKEKHLNIRLLMWDDEFRKVKQEDFDYWKLQGLVEPVVWKYTTNVNSQLDTSLWQKYANVFPKIWIASAFKGATGSNKYTTNIEYHLENHKSWMQIVSEYSGAIKFEGIIITGWQRYDHFSVLCELLPVGIPSLAMCLHFIQGYITSSSQLLPQTVSNVLQCENSYALLGSALGTPKCNFLGGDILEQVLKLQQLESDLTNILEDSKVKGWMSKYNVEHTYSNLMFVESATENLNMMKIQLTQIDADISASMSVIYDNYTIAEWRDTFIKPVNDQLDALWKVREKLLSTNYWPKRPLSYENKNSD